MKSIAILGAFGAACLCATTAFAGEVESAAVKTFGSCLNDGVYKTSAFIDYQVRRSGDGAGERRFVWEAGKAKRFAGVDAVEIKLQIGSETGFEYYVATKSDLTRYGGKSGSQTLSYDPGERFPGDLKSDATYAQTSDVTVTQGGRSQTGVSKRTLTFDCVETVRTPFGSYKACKLTEKSVVTPKGSSQVVSTRTEIEWFAAEGPYQGFRLRVKQFGRDFGGNFNFTYDVLKIFKYKVK